MIILHGEQRYEIYKSLKPGAKYINEIKVGDIQDKVFINLIYHDI